MIIYFAITNFKSFRDRTQFNMLAGNYKRFPEHIYTGFTPNILRCTAMYGSNAAGKSNFILAVEVLKNIVLGLFELENQEIPFFRLDEECKHLPTKFEVEFETNKHRYSYSISILNNKIIEEWLYKVFDNNKTEVVFERIVNEGKTKLKVGGNKRLSQKEQLRLEIYAEELNKRSVTPFILYGMEREIEIIKEPFFWFLNNLQVVRPNYYYPRIVESFESNLAFARLANQIVNALNLGIKNIKVEAIPIDDFFGKGDETRKKEILDELAGGEYDGMNFEKDGILYSVYKNKNNEINVARLVTIHDGIKRDVQFELNEESTGTQKIIGLLPAIINAILNKAVVLYDEIETSVHPCVIKELIKIYLDAGSEYEGQFIFSTHECNLLDLDFFRQDEIWFTEKDDSGVSHIYSLSDFKPRFDKDIRKGYLEGQFNQIPFFTEPEKLNWNL